MYKLAKELNIKGWVNNSSSGLNIHAEGDDLETFFKRLLAEAPPLSKIVSVNRLDGEFVGYEEFTIRKSKTDEKANVLISPDIATCDECLQDIRTPENRRYRYPFTNCTNCGPRYTIVRSVPYDRERTTMHSFPMCQDCTDEYENPCDRRFHAQPVACTACGPQVKLVDAKGNLVDSLGMDQISAGAIIAVKGLGGFHLVCDAGNSETVRRLRQLKERGAKPFALMARDQDSAQKHLEISPLEEELLRSPAAPIVILNRRKESPYALPDEIAPGLKTIGLMLPYTPLHHLLFDGSYDFLVMTSANLRGRPLIYENEKALAQLNGIADYFLFHDRDIYHPCDDSVIRVIGRIPVFMRRARGFVPLPSDLAVDLNRPILAVGGELKNSFCLAAGRQAFMSQYLGDMAGYENFQRFYQEVESFRAVVNIYPQAVAHDAHPDYQTTRYALDTQLPSVNIQHHHAHLVSVLGEHNRQEAALGIICDGTGFGMDSKIWGFEFIYGNAQGFERQAHLEYLPLPGGDAGAKYPLRIAYMYAKSLLSPEDWGKSQTLWPQLGSEERAILDRQFESGVQIYPTSSAGRLFDAISAILGICTYVTYEGQAAIELEEVAVEWLHNQEGLTELTPYPVELRLEEDIYVLGVGSSFSSIVKEILAGRERGEIAYRFHLTMAQAMVETAITLGVGEGPLVLNGGVFQNKLLAERVLELCHNHNIQVMRAKMLPPGDGGIAFGQILIANEVLRGV